MKKTLVRILSLLLVLVTVLPLAAGCNSGNAEEATTTTTLPEDNAPPLEGTDLELSQNVYAQAGLELMLNVIKKHYNARNNWLRFSIEDTNPCTLWGAGSFIEALAETYRIFPGDKTVKETYIDALNGLLDAYKVENVRINTPNSGSFTVTYYNATRGGRGDYYYGDNAWICIQFIEAYKLLGDESYLQKAEENLEFLWTGWDDVLGGGIYWDKEYGGKNSCANGPIAIAFLEAYTLTKKEEYLEKAKKIYEWSNEVLLDGSLYHDSIGKNGKYNNWKAAYNQGVYIHAAAQLYEITGEEAYYDHAKKVVNATIGLMFNVSGRGDKLIVTMKGNPIYKAWCIGWLARGFVKYYQVDPKKSGTSMTYLENVLDRELKTKDKKTGFYDPYFMTGDWKSENQIEILQVSGVASVFCIAAYYDVFVLQDKK